MRARNIKPGLFKNEILGQEDPMLTLLFVGLWCLSDRDGILEDRPQRIKGELFPYRESLDINGYLDTLARLEFIARYQVGQGKCILVLNFSKHQSPHHTERKGTLPKPPGWAHGGLTVNLPLPHGGNPPDSLIPDSLKALGQGREIEGMGHVPAPPEPAPRRDYRRPGKGQVSPTGPLDDRDECEPSWPDDLDPWKEDAS